MLVIRSHKVLLYILITWVQNSSQREYSCSLDEWNPTYFKECLNHFQQLGQVLSYCINLKTQSVSLALRMTGMALITFCMPNIGIELIIPMLLLLQLASCRNDTFLKAQLSKVLDYLSCCFLWYLLLGCTSEDVIKILMQFRGGGVSFLL